MQTLQLTYTDSLPVPSSHRSPFLTIWRHPRETVRWIVAENPSLHVIWLACLAGVGDLLSRDFARDTGDRSTVAIIVAILGACIRGPVWGLLCLWIFSHLIRWTGGLIGGKATREHLKAAMAWALVPLVCGVPLWIPLVVYSYIFSEDAPSAAAQPVLLVVALLAIFLVEVILAVWTIVLLCQTVAEVQGFRSGWRALANIVMAMSVVVASMGSSCDSLFMTIGSPTNQGRWIAVPGPNSQTGCGRVRGRGGTPHASPPLCRPHGASVTHATWRPISVRGTSETSRATDHL